MSPREKAIAVLSGGLDSTVSLAIGLTQYDVVLALTFNYGQRAFGKEVRASKAIADYYGVKHEVIALPWLSQLLPNALKMPQNGASSTSVWSAESKETEAFFEAAPVWVPNRNGLFLNIAACYAEAHEAEVILFGANAEEGERFPDNTDAFRNRVTEAFTFSTLNHPRIVCPVGRMEKPEIVSEAKRLDVPLQLIWSCYEDGAEQCGQCPSCFRLKRALETTNAYSLAFAH